VVQYQPIVRVADRRVVGVEALLRLRDDDGTLVHPTELQHAASPPGDLAREVMHRAGADVARWVGQGHDLWLSVDVGAQHVADIDGFVSDVSKALASAGLSADRLTVEMTENTLLNTTTRTLMGIEDLVASGIRFSIDDFGAGFGAMTSLRVMPVHELKIDCSFVADASSHPTATAIIRSIASLARELGIRCVAQGVERPAHHELVCETGVPLAQGGYYSSVLDASEVEAMLDSDRRADVH
jgi:EAL domain-containing protein (putative c-di-GMP-specific phosphodiesterase class I)